MKLTLATKNPGKLKELKEMSQDLNWLELLLAPDGFDPEETGNTYLENAIIKAKEAARLTNCLSIADDSGLEVDALDGRPGIHSARYCEGTDADRRKKMLNELKDVHDDRNAHFVCAMAIIDPCKEDPVFTTQRIWRGRISKTELGSSGFGFDPIFYPNEMNVTAAQISPEEKNLVSHRGQAWSETLQFLKKNFIPQ